MVQQPITMDDLFILLGVKEAEKFLLQKRIALLEQQVQALAEQLKPKDEEGTEGAVAN